MAAAGAQDLSENMGLRSLNERLQDPSLAKWFGNLFPRDSPRNMRFSINFFTSIGLGGLTDALRRHLADLPKILAAQREAAAAAAAAGAALTCSQACSPTELEGFMKYPYPLEWACGSVEKVCKSVASFFCIWSVRVLCICGFSQAAMLPVRLCW